MLNNTNTFFRYQIFPTPVSRLFQVPNVSDTGSGIFPVQFCLDTGSDTTIKIKNSRYQYVKLSHNRHMIHYEPVRNITCTSVCQPPLPVAFCCILHLQPWWQGLDPQTPPNNSFHFLQQPLSRSHLHTVWKRQVRMSSSKAAKESYSSGHDGLYIPP